MVQWENTCLPSKGSGFNSRSVYLFKYYIIYSYKMDNSLLPLMKSFLGQMDSAMKVSDVLAKHESSEEITVDHIIAGLVYRLMVPMTNEEIDESLSSAQQIIDKLDETDSEEDYDTIEEIYSDNVSFNNRKVKTNNCNCEICMKARTCLLNYHSYECKDVLAGKFKNAIEDTCNKHQIRI